MARDRLDDDGVDMRKGWTFFDLIRRMAMSLESDSHALNVNARPHFFQWAFGQFGPVVNLGAVYSLVLDQFISYSRNSLLQNPEELFATLRPSAQFTFGERVVAIPEADVHIAAVACRSAAPLAHTSTRYIEEQPRQLHLNCMCYHHLNCANAPSP
jgi:hypothetical protein